VDQIQLQDGTITQAEVNGIDLSGTSGYALLVPTGEGMSLAERLTESVEIQVERVNGVWQEKSA
jgi:hypothetical protein